MSIRVRKNQYRGVNAHLHSYFQAHGGWQMFHTAHINDLARVIGVHLPVGYRVTLEYSLQLREYHPDTGEKIRHLEPDMTIFQQTARSGQSDHSSMAVATQTLPLIDTLVPDEELYLPGITIYEVLPDASFGKPITQIELLSPTNKPGGGGYIHYQEKRYAALKSGLKLVEVGYLHETTSPIRGIASYRKRHPNAYPYYIAISNPQPSLEQGKTQIYEFSVDALLPTIDIPLQGSDTVSADFGLAYKQSFEGLPTFSDLVDYEQLPENFDSYSPSDQQRIKDRMQAIIEAHQRDIDLDLHVVYETFES